MYESKRAGVPPSLGCAVPGLCLLGGELTIAGCKSKDGIASIGRERIAGTWYVPGGFYPIFFALLGQIRLIMIYCRSSITVVDRLRYERLCRVCIVQAQPRKYR